MKSVRKRSGSSRDIKTGKTINFKPSEGGVMGNHKISLDEKTGTIPESRSGVITERGIIGKR